MANDAHLKILKEGVRAWNKWRGENPAIRPDLAGIEPQWGKTFQGELSARTFPGRTFQGNLTGQTFPKRTFPGRNFRREPLQANLDEAILSGADLSEHSTTFPTRTSLRPNLYGTKLYRGEPFRTRLSGANLYGTNLSGADLTGMYLRTILGNVDLSEAKGLETVVHAGPSTIGIDSIFRSKGKIPEVFLREGGCSGRIHHLHEVTGSESHRVLFLLHQLFKQG